MQDGRINSGWPIGVRRAGCVSGRCVEARANGWGCGPSVYFISGGEGRSAEGESERVAAFFCSCCDHDLAWLAGIKRRKEFLEIVPQSILMRHDYERVDEVLDGRWKRVVMV